jgi:hypothetical protein
VEEFPLLPAVSPSQGLSNPTPCCRHIKHNSGRLQFNFSPPLRHLSRVRRARPADPNRHACCIGKEGPGARRGKFFHDSQAFSATSHTAPTPYLNPTACAVVPSHLHCWTHLREWGLTVLQGSRKALEPMRQGETRMDAPLCHGKPAEHSCGQWLSGIDGTGAPALPTLSVQTASAFWRRTARGKFFHHSSGRKALAAANPSTGEADLARRGGKSFHHPSQNGPLYAIQMENGPHPGRSPSLSGRYCRAVRRGRGNPSTIGQTGIQIRGEFLPPLPWSDDTRRGNPSTIDRGKSLAGPEIHV